MTELTILGRGGQGGVTLAKLIAAAYFRRGKFVQAFGVYAAERSGAPLQAYVRIDDAEITNHNQVRHPNHVAVLDRTLIAPQVVVGQKPGGWLILNSPNPPEAFSGMLPGRRVATVDATGIALANGLGTRTLPIVNTTMLGAVLAVLGLVVEDVQVALGEVKLAGANVSAAMAAFEGVRAATLSGEATAVAGRTRESPTMSLFDDTVGATPTLTTGTWASQRPHRQTLTPPCNHGCPAGNDVRGFVSATARGEYDEALRLLLETSPFPAVCGRVCPAPCTEACNRGDFDEPIQVRELERYAAEHGIRPRTKAPWRSQRIAIIGSGPAGLSATYHLAKLGYLVTVFEANDELGGVLRTGIPAYRLPRDVLDSEIGYILDQGVIAHTGVRVNRRKLHQITQEFDAVFVATGLQHSQSIDLSDGKATLQQGIDFLNQVRRCPVSMNGQHVVVIGGGNTALDAARSARRLGANVRIVYRRTREQMPAIREEVEEALEEGVVLDELLSPLRLWHDGVGALLTCVRMRLADADESGRPRPVPEETEDAFIDLRYDRAILALGQSADLSILLEGSEVRDGQALVGLTGSPVFAGGDFATSEGTVAAAIGSGRRAAWHIHRTLTGDDLFPPLPEPIAGPEVIINHVFPHAPAAHGMVLPPGERRRSFAEVRIGFSDGFEKTVARSEAQRCFSCGMCNECDRCMEHCPEGILVRDGKGYRFDYDYCKGCGLCAAQCPRGVIYMAEL
ncbi:MAG: 2-oxoacid:acceptor oxidoreductase family protein [Planctomycetota bacterium]